MSAELVYSTPSHYVHRVKRGHYEVYRNGAVAATRCATIQFSDDPVGALARAIAECDRRSA